MTPERFHTLVEAWGADPRRWPEQERADALAWARAHRAEAETTLKAALELDAWLARDRVAPPSHALIEQIMASAPVPVPVRAQTPSNRRRFWWSGAAFAGAGLAGALAGALAMSLMLLGSPAPAVYGTFDAHEASQDPTHEYAHESSYLGTSFGGSSADWSDE
ncbi:hypothetical protein [Paraburkholderia sp.]|uniref:hypothetical protein n=1 Tax=Paraburkholderia sp. TaxID=1926495 RepID=UPI0025FAB99B|nr:hypothetical protein [Paraburkholderia sp.]